MRKLLVVAACTALAGCTAYKMTTSARPPAHTFATTPSGAAQICVVRPHSVAALAPAALHDNGRLVGMTKGPTYFCYLARPGRHLVASTYGDDVDRDLGTDQVEEAIVVAEAGRRYFLHHDVSN